MPRGANIEAGRGSGEDQEKRNKRRKQLAADHKSDVRFGNYKTYHQIVILITRPSAAIVDFLSSCTREPTQIQPLGSFARLSLNVREKWLQDNVSCGLQLTQTAQVGLLAAQLHSSFESFSHGVAICI